MKKLLTIFLLLMFLSSCGQKYIIGILRDNHDIQFAGKTTVFIGNSITKGEVGPSDLAHSWVSLFSAAKGTTANNMGVNGAIVQNFGLGCGGLFFDQTTIPAYNSSIHAALIMALGINDVGFNDVSVTPAAFKTQYTSNIQYAIATKGWPADKIILLNTYKPFSYNVYIGCISTAADATRAAAYNTKISEVASENGCRLVDIYTAMNGLNSSYFAGDQLHPNDAGHAFIANYLISVL